MVIIVVFIDNDTNIIIILRYSDNNKGYYTIESTKVQKWYSFKTHLNGFILCTLSPIIDIDISMIMLAWSASRSYTVTCKTCHPLLVRRVIIKNLETHLIGQELTWHSNISMCTNRPVMSSHPYWLLVCASNHRQTKLKQFDRKLSSTVCGPVTMAFSPDWSTERR